MARLLGRVNLLVKYFRSEKTYNIQKIMGESRISFHIIHKSEHWDAGAFTKVRGSITKGVKALPVH